MSSERTTEQDSDSEDNKADIDNTGHLNGTNCPTEDVTASDSCRSSINGSDSCGVSVNGSDSYNSSENTPGSDSPNDSHFGEPSINAIDQNEDCDSTYNEDNQFGDERAFSEPTTPCIKKPKLESLSTCDIKPNTNPFADREVLHQIMSQANGSDEFPVPQPTPDHNYAISPQKDDMPKIEPKIEVKEEIKQEPPEEEKEERSTSRYKVITHSHPNIWIALIFEYFVIMEIQKGLINDS